MELKTKHATDSRGLRQTRLQFAFSLGELVAGIPSSFAWLCVRWLPMSQYEYGERAAERIGRQRPHDDRLSAAVRQIPALLLVPLAPLAPPLVSAKAPPNPVKPGMDEHHGESHAERGVLGWPVRGRAVNTRQGDKIHPFPRQHPGEPGSQAPRPHTHFHMSNRQLQNVSLKSLTSRPINRPCSHSRHSSLSDRHLSAAHVLSGEHQHHHHDAPRDHRTSQPTPLVLSFIPSCPCCIGPCPGSRYPCYLSPSPSPSLSPLNFGPPRPFLCCLSAA